MLWGQRICRYMGQYAPELLDAVDEYTMEESPHYLNIKKNEYNDTGQFSSIIILQGEVSNAELDILINEYPNLDITLN